MTSPGTQRLAARLHSGEPVTCDGGTGAELRRRGWTGVPERAVADRPDVVREVHRAFLEAGADLLVANTFGAARAVAEASLAADSLSLARQAVLLAREVCDAAGREAFVVASLGPLGDAARSRAERRDAYRAVVGACLDAEPDGLFVETMTEIADADLALEAARERFDGPVAVTFAFDARGVGYGGLTLDRVADWARRAKPSAVGFNCGAGTRSVLSAGRRLVEAMTFTPLSLRPSGGDPEGPADRPRWPETPFDFFEFGRKARDLGCRLIGGCCGASPAHVTALRAGVASPL